MKIEFLYDGQLLTGIIEKEVSGILFVIRDDTKSYVYLVGRHNVKEVN